MAQTFRKIGVLTSGGDAPGMNAALRAVTRAALARGVKVVGIMKGYYGLIHSEFTELTCQNVANIASQGGTILYSDRCLEFKTEEGMAKAVQTCRDNEIDGIVAIGGDGTFRGATDLTEHGIPCIGIPATIDNDITSTDYAIGFDTAMNTVIGMADNLRDTCESHNRCNIIEVMGRDAGYIALETAIATGAEAVGISEIPYSQDETVEKLKVARSRGVRSMLCILAEGLPGEMERLEKRMNAETDIETRAVRLAHTVRGGRPTLRDRLVAARMGDCAVDALLAGKSNLVVCERGGEIVTVDIEFALKVDRMYKGKLQDGDLDAFSEEEVNQMKAICAKRTALMQDLYDIAAELGK